MLGIFNGDSQIALAVAIFYRPTECDYEFNAQKLALFVRSTHDVASDV
jgi:hypothetical protein